MATALQNGSVVIGLVNLENEIRTLIKKIVESNTNPDTETTQETLDEIQYILQTGVVQILSPVNLASKEGLIKLINVI